MADLDHSAGFHHREHPRWPVSIEVHVQAMGWDERMTLYTDDLSLGGAFLRTTRTIEKGTYLQLTFCIPGRKDLLAFAEVVREVPPELAAERATSAGIGVHYLDPDAAFIEGMKALIDEIASLAPRTRPVAPTPDTFEVSEDDYLDATEATMPESAAVEDDGEVAVPDGDDDWWAASVDQLNRHRIVARTEQGTFSPKEPAFDPLGAALGSDLPADPQGARPDVEQALADFAASIGHTQEPGASDRSRAAQSEALPSRRRDRDAPPVFESQPKGFIDVGKTMELYERCMKLIEAKSYAPAHQLAQDLLSMQPGNKKFLVALNLAAGGLYKSHGDRERAILHFQDAADLDETCKIAIEELRAVGMSRSQQKNVKSGLFAKLKDRRKTR